MAYRFRLPFGQLILPHPVGRMMLPQILQRSSRLGSAFLEVRMSAILLLCSVGRGWLLTRLPVAADEFLTAAGVHMSIGDERAGVVAQAAQHHDAAFDRGFCYCNSPPYASW